MQEETARGKSLEQIRDEYIHKWNCRSEDLDIEVLEKPGFFSRQWKVRVCLKSEPTEAMSQPFVTCDVVEVDVPSPLLEDTPSPESRQGQEIRAVWDEEKRQYAIQLSSSVHQINPSPEVGALYRNGEVQMEPFRVSAEDMITFIPSESLGVRTWEIVIRDKGLSAVAIVKHEKPGHYSLPPQISTDVRIKWYDIVIWEEILPQGEYWDHAHLQEDIQRLQIVHGIRPEAWAEIQAVQGTGVVVIAEATLPTAPTSPRFEDFVGDCTEEYDEQAGRIDFFAAKTRFVNEGTILARKIPGKEGIPGQDILGRPLPPPPVKDLQFKLKKNVKLSEDGLEVSAACAGLPIRVDETSYLVENIYLLNQDVDLATGSIEFPHDVFIYGNVQDGLHVYSGGKVEIQGSVSKADIRAEKGLKVARNVLGGHLVVGERHVIRSELLRRMEEIHEWLTLCLLQTEEMISSPDAKVLKPGQCLKRVIERRFFELPKIAADLEKFVLGMKDELLTDELILSVRTAKRFLVGLGPLEPKALPFLQRVNQVFGQMISNISVEVPEKLECMVDYIQGAQVECGGAFTCYKGTYNTTIQAGSDVKIEGVCRGGTVTSGGNVEIRELGGSEVSVTTVRILGTKRLKVEYCHPNVVIYVDKEIIQIEEAYRQLEVYRERGVVQVERLKAITR